ncbi:hypothetical protein FJT64_022861 [Amphibalanus amphitrite]|uniref:SGNH hydrolase-type esterase domain-containing protein n=1 Tax=Amphibalanus amphitrite TaxID=1232801 RepID=A0A6A4WHG1_AMPAM|nr:hypothetical protein FJT64_022861 [Amphibalanus amphitrite]
MSDLELEEEEEAAVWFEAHASPERPSGPLVADCGRLHLILGDSVAKRAEFSAGSGEDRILNRAPGGATWASLLSEVDQAVTSWQTAAAAIDKATGMIVVWLTGNDIYSKLSGLPRYSDASLKEIARQACLVLQRLRVVGEVIVLGPLPRLAGELRGCTWNSTAAYRLERTLLRGASGRIGYRGSSGTVPRLEDGKKKKKWYERV